MAEDRAELFLKFTETIDETAQLFEQLIDFEEKKLDAIAVNNVTLLEQLMNDEQAYLMRLRGLDQRRDKLQQQLGWDGRSFREIIEACEDGDRDALEKRLPLLSAKTEELKAAVAASKKYIELHIHGLDGMLERLAMENPTYDKNGEKKPSEATSRFKPTRA